MSDSRRPSDAAATSIDLSATEAAPQRARAALSQAKLAVTMISQLELPSDIPPDDLIELLSRISALSKLMKPLRDQLVVCARLRRVSWRTLGDALGCHHTTVRERYRRVVPPTTTSTSANSDADVDARARGEDEAAEVDVRTVPPDVVVHRNS